jgi:Tfp pilus assembly protein PilW
MRLRIRPKRWNRQIRQGHGVYLVELLVALGLGSLLTLALVNVFSNSMRHASHTQNELIAHAIVRELQESTRASGYDFLEARQGVFRIASNSTGSESFPDVHDSPAQLNFLTQTWKPQTKKGAFTGVTDYSIAQGPQADTLTVTIKVSWADSLSFGTNTESPLESGKSIIQELIVHRYGTNAYAQ